MSLKILDFIVDFKFIYSVFISHLNSVKLKNQSLERVLSFGSSGFIWSRHRNASSYYWQTESYAKSSNGKSKTDNYLIRFSSVIFYWLPHAVSRSCAFKASSFFNVLWAWQLKLNLSFLTICEYRFAFTGSQFIL